MLIVNIGERSTGEGHENACLKKLYINAVGWLPRVKVLVIRKPASLSFQGITFSGLQVQGKQLLWGGGLCWRGGNDGQKGVEHCIFKEHATGQGMKPSLERFAVRMRIKQAWGKSGFCSQGSEDRRHLWLITKGVQTSNCRRHWQQKRMIFCPYMEAAWSLLEMILLSLKRVKWI